MKSGIFNWFGFVLPIADRLKMIKEAGFDNVMLWWEDEDYPHFTDKKTFVTLAKDYGLGVDNIHLPYEDCNLLWSDSAFKREAYVNKVFDYLEGCKSSGAEKVVMHTNRGSLTDADYKYGYKSFEQIINLAEAIKIKIAVENTKKFEYTEFILNEFDSKNLGLCYDSSHDFINGESKGLILNKWKDRLFCVHLSDNDGTDDKHWLPQKGIVDFKSIVGTIKTTACNSLSMEVYPAGEEKKLSPEEFLKLAYETNRSIMI